MNYLDAIESFAHLVPGCPAPEAVQALRSSAAEFAERTTVMTQWFETTSDLLSFDTAGAGVLITNLLDAYVGEDQAHVAALNSPRLLRADASGPVLTHGVDINTSLALVPNPAQPATVRLLVVLVPTHDADSFSDTLWNLYREALIDGAVSRLLYAPGTSYVNGAEAARREARFERKATKVASFAGSMRATPARRLRVAHADGFVARERGKWNAQTLPHGIHQVYWTESDYWTPTNYWM